MLDSETMSFSKCKRYYYYYLLFLILSTISSSFDLSIAAATANRTPKFQTIWKNDVGSFSTSFDSDKNASRSSEVEPFRGGSSSTNVPISFCGQSGREYANLELANLDPPCSTAALGYCGLLKNRNYTFLANFLMKRSVQALSVQVTTVDPFYQIETPLWPEFNVCSRFNITCPQNSNALVESYLYSEVPKEVPRSRTLVRVRLLGMSEDFVKRVYICRQLNVQFF